MLKPSLQPIVTKLARLMRALRDLQFVALVLVGFAAGALLTMCGGDVRKTSVTRVDNLEVLGTTTLGTGTVTLRAGSNTPEGAVTASVGSLFLRDNGSTGATLYVKESGGDATGWTAVGAGGGGASSFGAVSATTNTTSAHCNGNLSSLAANDWIGITGGTGMWGSSGTIRAPSAGANSAHYKRTSRRLVDGTYFVFGTSASGTNSVAFADPTVTSTATDDVSGVAMNTGITLTLTSATQNNQGMAFDLPMEQGESGAFTVCFSYIHVGIRIRASVMDNSATPIDNNAVAVPNPGATRRFALVSFPFTIGKATRMRISFETVGATGNTEFGPAYAYF